MTRGEEPGGAIREAAPARGGPRQSVDIHAMSGIAPWPPEHRCGFPGGGARAAIIAATQMTEPGNMVFSDWEPRRRPRDTEMRAGRSSYRTPPCKAWRTITTLCKRSPGKLRAAETPVVWRRICGSSRRLCGRRDGTLDARETGP